MMDDQLHFQVPLPEKVEDLIRRICSDKNHQPPDLHARKKLAEAGEETALEVLRKIYTTPKPIRTLDGFIVYLVKLKFQNPNQISTPESKFYHYSSPPKLISPSACASPVSPPPQIIQSGFGVVSLRASPLFPVSLEEGVRPDGECSGHQILKRHVGTSSSNLETEKPNKICRQLAFVDEPQSRVVKSPQNFSYQATVLSRELEFRREFLIYNYIGGNKLEEVIYIDDADEILKMKHITMDDFESRIWNAYGSKYCPPEDRRQTIDWDSGKTHLYYCYVSKDERYIFKGPFMSTVTTHLQRTLGDDHVLIVKFVDVSECFIERILKEGISVGLRRFHFFVFKDENRDKKKKGTEKDETPVSTALKCYFVRLGSLVPCDKYESHVVSRSKINEARCHYMHVHMVSSLAKYMARFSLILSTTIKLPIDLSKVVIEEIEDIPCRDENGCVIRDEAGEPLILTDGTGFISEDLAVKCPENFCKAKYVKDKDFKKICHFVESVDGTFESVDRKPPLLMQCRLFSKGSAVKGTLLVNRKLGVGRIQVRPSMVKVKRDINCTIAPTFDSLEIVTVSHKPRRCQLSKNLIALLSYGGVPRSFFMDLLMKALEETQTVFSNWFSALKVAITNGDIDDNATAARMISAGVPLNEPDLQTRLARLTCSERRSLGDGKLPIGESFYLMGTADPTGVLKRDQVCVILENGQISGNVLVYRNPGLHFGDVHILEAVYVRELEDVVGNAKFGIFFSTEGQRSAATEMANGDFDGDSYWVSINPQLLSYFRPSKPWTRVYSTPSSVNKSPTEFSAEELESEIFQLFLNRPKQSSNVGIAADSWLAFMDRLLIPGDNDATETEDLKQKMLKLIDIYYDAVDAPKSGKKVNVPPNLKAEKYPHYMRRKNSYVSKSILGDIFDKAEQFQCEGQPKGEIWKLPCFNAEIPVACIEWWRKKYNEYRNDMVEALKNEDSDLKKSACNEVIKKYKQLLYEAAELQESLRDIKDIYNDALAIYHVTYDHAIRVGDISKCGFAWRVAGAALCKYHAIHSSSSEDPILMLPSVLRNILS